MEGIYMKGLLFSLLLTVPAFANASALPAIDNNYCRDDVYNYVALRFGPDTQITKQFRIGGNGTITHYIWFQVDACEGDIVAVFRGEGWQCTCAQYGSRIQLLTYVYARSESCKQWIPSDDFTDLYQ